MSARELLITDGMKDCSWWIEEKQSELDPNSAEGQVLDFGLPIWMGQATFRDLNAQKWRALSAWIARRRRSAVTFTMFRPLMRAPLLNPSQTNSGLGVGTINIAASTAVFTGLSVNVSAGDMFSYRTLANGYWVGQATEDVTISSGSATVPVWPPPMAKHATTPQARAFEALGEFYLVGTPQNIEQHNRRSSVSLTFKQFVE